MRLRDLLSWVLFRKYRFDAAAYPYVLRIGRVRLYWRGARAEVLRDYAQDMINAGKTPLLPPGCRVFVDVD